jgi:hypothetical protein
MPYDQLIAKVDKQEDDEVSVPADITDD